MTEKGDDQEDPLHYGIVALVDRLAQHAADAAVFEDLFYQQRAADDEADADGQNGKERQDCIAAHIGGCDAPFLQPACFGNRYIIFT